MVISPSYGMFGETFYRADCGTEFSKASFLLRGKKKRKKRKKTTTIPRRTAVSIFDEGNKNTTLTVVLPPNVLMAIIQQIIS